jgi:hypothetical protein
MVEPKFNSGARLNRSRRKAGNVVDAVTYDALTRADNYKGWQKLSTNRCQNLTSVTSSVSPFAFLHAPHRTLNFLA